FELNRSIRMILRNNFRKNKKETSFTQIATDTIKVYLVFVLPFIIIAAFLETYITDAIFQLFLTIIGGFVMRGKLVVSFILLLLIVSIGACSRDDDQFEQEAMEVGEAFLETLYNEDDTEFDMEDITIINEIKDEYEAYLT